MFQRAVPATGIVIALVFALIVPLSTSHAKTEKQPLPAGSPHDLVNAVNALRASFGLPSYSTSPILMSTAQAQADFLASTGTMTHSGPNGIGLTERLLAAGYPLAGDLSLGGFRAENITGGDESMPAEAAVDWWMGDAPHLNTMVSQSLTEIGAGVAIRSGKVYYVINAARPTTIGGPQVAGTAVQSAELVPEAPAIIIPVSVSTPNADGNVIHEVKPGQTLWQIAITYETKIDEIKRLNNLFDNNIYPGNKLLIRSEVIVPTVPPAAAPAQISTPTSLPTLTPAAGTAATTSTPRMVSRSAVTDSTRRRNAMIGIIVLAIIGGGIFTFLGSTKKRSDS